MGEVAAGFGRVGHERDELETAAASRQPAGATFLTTTPAGRGGGARLPPATNPCKTAHSALIANRLGNLAQQSVIASYNTSRYETA